MKIFKEGGMNWDWYNIESENGGAISFRLHRERHSELQGKLKNMGEVIGKSCPVHWVNYKDVKDGLRDTEYDELKPIIEEISKVIGKDAFTLACPCNTKRY